MGNTSIWAGPVGRDRPDQSAFHLTGPFDYPVFSAGRDVASLDSVIRGWKKFGLGAQSNTRILLNEVELR